MQSGLVTAIRKVSRVKEIGISLALLGLFVLFSILSPYFFQLENFITSSARSRSWASFPWG